MSAMAPTPKLTAAERERAKQQAQLAAYRVEQAARCARYDGTPWEQSRVFEVTLRDGRTVRVDYQSPRDAGGGGGIHLQFRGDGISSTGYRSDFVSEPPDGYQGTPEQLAHERAEALAVEAVKAATRLARYEKRKQKEATA